MANKYVQYGAVVAGAAAIPAVAKGIGAASQTFSTYQAAIPSSIDSGAVSGVAEGYAQASTAALDAGASAFSSTLSSVVSPQFLATAGLGLVGLALGSGSKRPTLSFPNLAATAAVALNVANLLQQGKTAANAFAQSKAGQDVSNSIGAARALRGPGGDVAPEMVVSLERLRKQTYRLVYPHDLTSQYYIRFALHRYERLDVAKRSLNNAQPHTTIRLPIPNSLVDAIGLAYQDVGLGQFLGAFFENTMGAYGKSTETNEVMKILTSTTQGAVKMLEDDDLILAIARRVASQADPGFGVAIDLATGTAPNPHMALSFQGVSMKKYQFSWRFSPNNEKESRTLHEIIRNLQASALPEKRGQFLLTFPDVVSVELSPANLFYFKPMMIDHVAINYAPSGSPSFYRESNRKTEGHPNQYPTEIELSISLREIDIHTASDEQYAKVRSEQNISNNPYNMPINTDPGYNQTNEKGEGIY